MSELHEYLDSFPEILYVTDMETHNILYMNNAGKKVFCSDGKKKCYEIIRDLNEPCETCCVTASNKDEWQTWEAEKSGRLYGFRSRAVTWDGKDAILCIAIDITNMAKLNREITLHHRIEDFTFQCIAEMHREQPYEQMFNNLLMMIGKFLDADRVYIYICGGSGFSRNYEWCNPNLGLPANSFKDITSKILQGQMPHFHEQCIVIRDTEELRGLYDHAYELFKAKNTHSQITMPIIYKREVIGIIGVDNPPSEKLDNIDLFFTTISYFIASVLSKERNEQYLKRIGYIDTLTKLYNRNKYIEDISALAEKPQKNLGVLYVDLNGLKEINDKYGHAAGDIALCEISELIRRAFGESRSYRVGGDEFVAVCPECNKEDFFESVDFLRASINNSEYSASVGYKFSSDKADINLIIKEADEMMYQDKKHFYRHQKQTSRYRHMNDLMSMFSTPEQINEFISNDRFFVLFQPRFDSENKEFCASEALVRYIDESGTTISPMDFIPEMEFNDIINIIDMYVFRHVLESLEEWIKHGKKVKPVSINISQKTMLTPSFIKDFMKIWEKYKVPKNLIQIEISEDRDKGGIDEIIPVLSELKNEGFEIAVDNFGYKYADLYLFADFKFDLLKLDKDLVRKIEADDKTRRLFSSLAYICHSDNVRIVAEGVENEYSMNILRELGCDEVQGYLFDGPLLHKQLEEKYL